MNSGHVMNICGENEKLQVCFKLLCKCRVQFIVLIPLQWDDSLIYLIHLELVSKLN